MDSYFLKDYLEGKKDKKSREKVAEKRRKKRALDLFEKGIGIEEIAEIMEVDVSRVKRYIGEDKIEEKMPVKDLKLTHSRVEKLVSTRNERIKGLHDLGLSIQEIADREKLTLDQAKEIFLSLGLPIYTTAQIEEMMKQRASERNESSEVEPNTEEVGEVQEVQEAEGVQPEQEGIEKLQKTVEETIRSYEDIKNRMQQLIQDRNSKEAVRFGEIMLEDADFLTGQEREKLFMLIEHIKEIREIYTAIDRMEKGNDEER